VIYFTTTDGRACLIIEPGNIQRLKEGKPMVTPDDKFMVCFTPDMPWTCEQVLSAQSQGKITPEQIAKIIDDGKTRSTIDR
jgi:hypothetical protein